MRFFVANVAKPLFLHSLAVYFSTTPMSPNFKKRLAGLLGALLALTPPLANAYEYKHMAQGLVVQAAVPASSIAVSTEALDFSGKVVGTTSQLSFTVTNAGAKPVVWSKLPAVAGNASFTLGTTSCSGTMAAGSSCTVAVRFSPTQVAAVPGEVRFTASGISKVVALTGSGDGTHPLDIEGPSPALTTRQGEGVSGPLTITNNTAAPVVLGTVSVAGIPASSYFAVNTANCNGKTLQPGGSCAGTLSLSGGHSSLGPYPAGTFRALVSVPFAGATQTYEVSGTVVAREYILLGGGSQSNAPWDAGLYCYNAHAYTYGGSREQYACAGGSGYFYADNRISCTTCAKYIDGVSLSAASLAFSGLTVGVPQSRQVVVQNIEKTPVDLNSTLSVTGGTAGDVALSSSCGATLAPAQTCLVQVDITPSKTGGYSGRVVLQSNTIGSPHYIYFSGSATYLSSNVGAFTVPPVDFGSEPFTLTAPTSSSPGAWSYTSSNPAVATVAGNTVTVLAGGSTTITATQAASGSYGPTSVTATLQVRPIDPVVGAWTEPSKVVGVAATLTPPSSNSTGAWTYTVSDASAATVTGANITFSKAGTFTLTAKQAATPSYKTATATTSVTVSPGAPVVGAWAPFSVVSTATPFVLTFPSSSSTGAWSATSSNPAVATISNGVVTVVGAGTTTLTATQAATADYVSASATTTLTVSGPVDSTKLMWQFNGTAGTTATAASLVSDTGLTAAASSGVTYTAGGVEGNYGRFSGGSIDVYSPEFNLSNKLFTFEWWQRGATSMAQFTFGNPSQYSTAASNGSGIYFSTSGSNWGYVLYPGTLSASSWTHMAVVRTSTHLVLYQNGVSKATTPIGSNIPLMAPAGNRLAFGAYAGGSTMDIDQVRLTVGVARYNGTFTPSTNLSVD